MSESRSKIGEEQVQVEGASSLPEEGAVTRRSGAFKLDLFHRYVDPELELQFIEFIRSEVSASLIILFGIVFVTFLFIFQTVSDDTPEESATLINATGFISVLTLGVTIVWQAALVIVSRCKPLTFRVGQLNQQSEWLMVVLSLVSGTASRVYITSATTNPDCAASQVYVYKSSGDHGVYDEALCERQFSMMSIMIAFVIAVRRQRLITLVGYASMVILVNIALAIGLPTHHSFPAYHWLSLVMFAGMLALACVVRFTLESAERRYFESQLRLQTQRQLLEKLSAEDEAFVGSLLPQAIINRSARSHASKLDEAKDAIVVVLSVADFTKVASELMAIELYTQLVALHHAAVAYAEPNGLYKMLALSDEVVLVANLIQHQSSLRTLVRAVDVALNAVSINKVAFRLRAAVQVGSLRGGFHGGSWIRYDISGPALDEARAASHHASAGQVMLTDDAYHGCREQVVVNEGCSAEESGGATLWLVESCHPPESTDNTSALVENASENPLSGSVGKSSVRSSVTESNAIAGLQDVAKATKAAADEDGLLAEESTWLIFHRFVDPAVEAEYVQLRMVTMTQRATKVWCAFAWLQLVFVIILMADFFPHSSELALILLLVSIALSLVVALVPTALSTDQMSTYHTPWSILALLTPLLTTLAMASSRPSALGVDVRPLMMVGALLRVPCLYHERHQLILIPLFILLSQSSFLLPGSGLQVWTFPYIAVALYVIVTSSESDHAQRRNFVAQKQILLTLDALERQQRVRRGLVRATLPTPILKAWTNGGLELGCDTASLVPDTVAVCVSSKQTADTSAIGSASEEHIWFTTDRLLPVERAAQSSSVLNIVKVVGDLCILVAPVGVSTENTRVMAAATIAQLPNVLRALLELCSGGRYGALMDIDSSIQVLSTSGLPTFSVYGVVLTRLLTIAAATSDAWSGLSTLERNMAGIRESMVESDLVEHLQPPLRIRGVGMLRLVKLSS